jgi:hypothetical protein
MQDSDLFGKLADTSSRGTRIIYFVVKSGILLCLNANEVLRLGEAMSTGFRRKGKANPW